MSTPAGRRDLAWYQDKAQELARSGRPGAMGMLRALIRQVDADSRAAGAEPGSAEAVKLQEMAANLASINEILTEMVNATAEPGFALVVATTLRDHSWRLGFTFQGARPPPGWGEEDGS